jgi:alkylglycerol monooxygenase
MTLNYMALAVPLFLLLIGIEYWFSKRLGRQLFNFNSSIANMNVGVAERLIDMFTAGSFFFFYDYLQKNYGLFEIHPTLLMWIALILATDFVWYWYHRLGHKINLFWGFHVVHHTSEEFNYTAGTRITVFQAVIRTTFWSVLPLIGFPGTDDHDDAHCAWTIPILHAHAGDRQAGHFGIYYGDTLAPPRASREQ